MLMISTTGVHVIKLFSSSLTMGQNKLECFSLTRLSAESNIGQELT